MIHTVNISNDQSNEIIDSDKIKEIEILVKRIGEIDERLEELYERRKTIVSDVIRETIFEIRAMTAIS